MKTKLLKKIRKQYSIVKYTEVGDNASNFLVECRDKLHYPFYVLSENGDWVMMGCSATKTLQEAKDNLLKYIRENYREYSVKNKVKKRKVWYNK